MADSQPRHPQAPRHPMSLRSESLFGPFAVDPVDQLASGARCVHAGFDSTMAFFSAPVQVAATDAVVVGGRHDSSSSEETEEGFVVVADEVGAPWDSNHTNNPAPNLVSTAIHSARHSWISILPSRLRPTASSLPSHSLPQQQQPQSSTQDVGGWEMEPPLLLGNDAFALRDGAAKQRNDHDTRASTSADATPRLNQAQLADPDEAKRPGGLFFVVQDQRGDPLGESVAWQRRGQPGEGSGDGEKKKAVAVLEAWRAKEERGERVERDTRSGGIRPREDSYERIGGPATGYTGEKLEVYRREQMLRIGRREERLAELRRLTDEMVLQIGGSKRMGGVASGRTQEEAELRLREQMWRRGSLEGAATLERRIAGRRSREAAGRG